MIFDDVKYALLWWLLFILSAPVHEAAHAWVAKKEGDPTAYMGGQVSLNPIPHIKHQPLGLVVIPLITAFTLGWPFGFASAPYDPVWAHRHPRRAALMAAAGPAATLLIVLICVLLVKIGIFTGLFLEPDKVNYMHIVDPASEGIMQGVSTVISMLFTLNLVMFILNIIPLPPLDGSSIIPLFMKDETARKYKSVVSHWAFYIICLLLVWFGFAYIFDFIFVGAINTIYWGAGFH